MMSVTEANQRWFAGWTILNMPAKKYTYTRKLFRFTRRMDAEWVVGILMIVVAAFWWLLIKDNTAGVENIRQAPPEPVLMRSWCEENTFSLTDSIKIFSRIRNEGGDGNVSVTFVLVHGKTETRKTRWIKILSGDIRYVEQSFEMVEPSHDHISYQVLVGKE